ncbi:MAG TPA: RNA polymerase sigma factor [Vicinamibacterales bacterium]|nr:RNA polymerase sigma factor [Vicinamibacterales bacterium]
MSESPEVAAALERARAGDPDAFGFLVDRFREPVFRAALAATGSPAEAEDAAQDAFVAAYRRLNRFRGDSSFKTWLLTIVWNKALDRRRAMRRTFLSLETEDGVTTDPPSLEQPTDAALVAASAHRAARTLIAALPVKLRDPLLLAASGEHSYTEMATMLGVPVGTLKWRISEARRIMREKLQRLGY